MVFQERGRVISPKNRRAGRPRIPESLGLSPTILALPQEMFYNINFSSVRGSGGYTTFKGISLRLLGGWPRADRARCQLANPTSQRRQGVAEAARWGFHCGREGHRGLPGPFLRAAPEPFLTEFGVRGHLARLGARLAQPPDHHHATPAPRRGAPGVCPGAADTLSGGAGGPGPAGGR